MYGRPVPTQYLSILFFLAPRDDNPNQGHLESDFAFGKIWCAGRDLNSHDLSATTPSK